MPDRDPAARRQGFASHESVEAGNSKVRSRSGGSFKGASEDAFGASADGIKKKDVAQAGRGERLSSKAKTAAASAFIEELDDSDELSGTSNLYHSGRTAADLRARRKAKLGTDPFASAEESAAGAAAEVGASSEASAVGGATDAATKASASKVGAASANGSSAKSLLQKAKEGLGGKAMRRSAAKGAKATTGAAALEDAQAVSNYAKSRAALGTATEAGANAAKAKAGGGLAAAVSAAAPVLGGILAGIAAFVVASLLLSALVSALVGFWEDEQSKEMLQGLPSYITYDMVLEALECQDKYGHPAGCTLAQIICESGQGDTMSQLATRDNNLFGIKWSSSFASCPEVTGKASWATHEEVNGQVITIMADFTVFRNAESCIRFRSRVLLQNSRYAGNTLIKEAIEKHDSDKMAEGLKDAGYATSSDYVESLKTIMKTYDLYRFDGISAEDFKSGTAMGNVIVQAAFSQLGVPYAWGGETPGKGLDCSGLTQYCYRQAGIRISHYTEDQLRELTVVPLSQAQPGDILYKYGHVAIYIGGDEYIHEPHTGDVCRRATGISYFTCALRYTG